MSKNMMQWTLGLLAIGCMLAMAVPAGAEMMDSADFTWKYEMTTLEPSEENLDAHLGNTTLDFTEYDTGGSISASGGVLELHTTKYQKGTYRSQNTGELWIAQGFTFAGGYTYEVSIQVLTQDSQDSAYGTILFLVSPDTVAGNYEGRLTISPDGQAWGAAADIPLGVEGTTYDNSDGFHTFRVAQVASENEFYVWRDDVLIADGIEGAATTTDRFFFGDSGSHYGGNADIDYLRIQEGAYAPIPEPGTLVLLAGGLMLLLLRRRW
jgi:hypothetical protein